MNKINFSWFLSIAGITWIPAHTLNIPIINF